MLFRHQMSKYKTHKAFFLNNLGGKHSLLMKLAQFM